MRKMLSQKEVDKTDRTDRTALSSLLRSWIMLVMETMRCVASSVFGVTLKLNIESTLTALCGGGGGYVL